MYVKTIFIHDELWANNKLLLISGVKSPLISYLLSREAIRGLKMAWDMRLVNIIYRYFKHDNPSHIWRNNTLTMTNIPRVGQVRQFYFFIFMLTSPWLRIYIPHTIPCAWKDQYNLIHTKTSTHDIENVIGFGKKSWRTNLALRESVVVCGSEQRSRVVLAIFVVPKLCIFNNRVKEFRYGIMWLYPRGLMT